MEKDQEKGYEPSNISVSKEFYDLDTDVSEMLRDMNFNPIQQLAQLYPIAAQAGEFNAAYNIGKFLAGYVKPQAKQSEQKVVVQILHQGQEPVELLENRQPIQLSNYTARVIDMKELQNDGSNTVTVQLDA